MLTLICGIPNAGKTTYSRRFDNVVHLDELKASESDPLSIKHMLESETGDICVEGLVLSAHARKSYIRSYGGNGTKCIWMDTPLDECIRREDRGRATFIIENSASVWEPPTYDEGWDEIEVIR